ncbi:MAG: magnesium transporter [Nitratireductor sp.]
MVENQNTSKENLTGTANAQSPSSDASIYDIEGHILPHFTQDISNALDQDSNEALVELIEPLHESELADVLEAITPNERKQLVEKAGANFDLTSLTEVDEAIRLEIVDHLPNEKLAKGLMELDSDDAVYILEDMEAIDQEDILQKLPFDERVLLKRSLDYPEDSAGRRMQTEVIAVPPFWTIGQTIDYMREDEKLPDRFYEIFVVSPGYELLGSLQLDRLLRSARNIKIETLMTEASHPIDATLDQEEAALIFQQYDLLSAAVLDESARLVGMITIDDIVDVINQEAEEDIKRLGGVGDEELSDSVPAIAKSRFLWLLVNLFTAILASYVISLFDASIEQMVALAVLMPIVASMGGNAGTQTMTVAVRALAKRDIDSYNSTRIVTREVTVGLLNGIAFAILIGLISFWWFGNKDLGLVVGIAMVFNLVCAALAGILIPLGLDKLEIDPAIASSVFVTTVTDVVGFFVFLSLAAFWFNLA